MARGKKSKRVPTKAKKARHYRAAAAKKRAKLAPKRLIKKVKVAPVSKLSPKLAKKIAEQNRKAEALMVRGRQRGFVTYDEILKAFPNIETDVMFLEELYE